MIVSLYCRVEQDLPQEYLGYVHLLNDGGQNIAQSEQRPWQEYYPSSLWKPGGMPLDVHILPTPVETHASAVTLVAGVYQYPSLSPLGGTITLGAIDVGN